MKYLVKKDDQETTCESFSDLLDMFDGCEDLEDLEELKKIIPAGCVIVEDPEDADILELSGMARSDVRYYLDHAGSYVIYTSEDLLNNLGEYLEQWGSDEETSEQIRQMVSSEKVPDPLTGEWVVSSGYGRVWFAELFH